MGIFAGLVSGLKERISENRRDVATALANDPEVGWVSPALALQREEVLPFLRQYAKGRLLDIGAGTVPLRDALGPNVSRYQTLDIERRTDNLDFVGDIQDLGAVIATESFDTVMALEVLEHVPNSGKALAEMYRILVPGGMALISVPHLSRLHEEPHDYYRFTGYGLRQLFERAGFEVVNIAPIGGLFCFLGHQVALLSMGATWHVGGLQQAVLQMNKWLISKPAMFVDKLTTRDKFPLGYLLAARKP